jgi:hypothetical protein
MSNEKNLLENLPETIEEMSPEQFGAYSDALAKGEIEPIAPKTEETPAPGNGAMPNGEETDEEKAAREKKEQEEAAAKDKSGKVDLTNKENPKDSPSMSLSKYKQKKKNWEKAMDDLKNEHAKEIEALKTSISAPNSTSKTIDEDLKKFAEENGINDIEVVKNLVGFIAKSIPGTDPETKKAIEDWKKSKAEEDDRKAKDFQETEFEKDFLKTAEPLIRKLNPNIDEAHLSEAKKNLKELAFGDKYLKLPLEEIITLKESKFKFNLEKKKTVETSRPGSKAGTLSQDYENWTAEDIDAASPEEFEKYSNHMATIKGGSRYKVTDKNGNEVK